MNLKLMNLKKFLKPTKFKLGLFGLIFIIIFITFVAVSYFEDLEYSTNIVLFFIHRFFAGIATLFVWPLLVTTLFDRSLYYFFLQSYLEPNIFVPIVEFIPLIIYLYILACFTKWLIDRRDEKFIRNVLILFGVIVLAAEIIVFTFIPYTPSKPFTPSPLLPIPQTQGYMNFKSRCDALCQNFEASGNSADAARFCAEKLAGNTDLNRNGKSDAFQTGTYPNYVCEDGLYCFHVSTCLRNNSVPISSSGCREILCNSYFAIYQNYLTANQKVRQIFANGIGACTLPTGEANWYQLYFGNNPCTTGLNTTTSLSPTPATIFICNQQGNTSVNCRWSCSNVVSSQNPGILSNDVTFQTVTITQSSGNYTFTNLITGNTYNFGLVCGSPQSQIPASYTITLF